MNEFIMLHTSREIYVRVAMIESIAVPVSSTEGIGSIVTCGGKMLHVCETPTQIFELIDSLSTSEPTKSAAPLPAVKQKP